MNSDIDLILDDFQGNIIHIDNDDINIDKNKDKDYYIGKAIYLLKQFEGDTENYFHFLCHFLKNFNILNDDHKEILKDIMNIKETIKIVEKEKIIYKEKKTKLKKINMYDDY